jgi:hypothetical protein
MIKTRSHLYMFKKNLNQLNLLYIYIYIYTFIIEEDICVIQSNRFLKSHQLDLKQTNAYRHCMISLSAFLCSRTDPSHCTVSFFWLDSAFVNHARHTYILYINPS